MKCAIGLQIKYLAIAFEDGWIIIIVIVIYISVSEWEIGC